MYKYHETFHLEKVSKFKITSSPNQQSLHKEICWSTCRNTKKGMYTYKWYKARQNTCLWWPICLTKYKKMYTKTDKIPAFRDRFVLQNTKINVYKDRQITCCIFSKSRHGLCILWGLKNYHKKITLIIIITITIGASVCML